MQFIIRTIGGREREGLAVAAERLNSVWMPWGFTSIATGRGSTKKREIKVAPLMPYLICEATAGQLRHALEHRSLIGPVWFVPDCAVAGIQAWQGRVEDEFNTARDAWLRDERLFHCNFRAGQAVRLELEGRDLFEGVFKTVAPDGRYQIEAAMMGRKVVVMAEPYRVQAVG